MTSEGELDVEMTPLPRESRVDFDVECRSSPYSTIGDRHRATLLEDWTVLTPHDLDAERVGLAFGGFCDCLALVETGVRAAQRWWQLASRQAVPEITFRPVHGWQCSLTTGCTCTSARDADTQTLRFRTAGEAWVHETSAEHLAARLGARPHHARALVDALRPLVNGEPPARRAWESVANRLREPDALKVLWDCGLHPSTVADGLRVAASVTGRLPASFALGLAFVPDRAVPRRQEIARQRDAELATWLVWDGTAPDPRRPVESGEWLGLGLTPRQCREMLSSGITIALAEELAQVLAQPVKDCAHLLLDRPAPGLLPELDQLLAGAADGQEIFLTDVGAQPHTQLTDPPLLDPPPQERPHGDPHAH